MRVTPSHWEAFLEIAEKNEMLTTNKFNGIQGKSLGNTLWKSVAVKLNGLGFGEKTVNEWRRAVTDWKSKAKAKTAKIKSSLSQTGGGSLDSVPLTALEEILLNLMGTKSFEGDVGAQELGQVNRSTPETSVPQMVNEVEIASASPDQGQCSTHVLGDRNIVLDHDYLVSELERKRKAIYEGNKNDCGTMSRQEPKRQKITATPRISKNLQTLSKR